jgi:hypothetical protein
MDNNNRQIVLFFGQHQIQQIRPFSGWSVFSFTESLILAQDERWRRA